jgi:hypothetical protein
MSLITIIIKVSKKPIKLIRETEQSPLTKANKFDDRNSINFKLKLKLTFTKKKTTR